MVFERLYQMIASNNQFQGISLNVQCKNKTIIRFYQRMGFTQVAMMQAAEELTWIMKINTKVMCLYRDSLINTQLQE